ncbi:MAG: 2,4-diaminopentanoate dehydrogenase [Candidatus Izemoplasmatales bacterium]|nr:2,4-diaminopentanoate dehydrogenase [Candidatus Izemoplasmatales bacterium]
MKRKIKVAIWGFGAMGSGMARMINSIKGFDLVGVCDKYDKYQGKSVFEILASDNPYDHDVLVEANIVDILKNEKPDIVLLATDSFTKDAFPKIKLLLEHGTNVISTAEEMAYPKANEPLLAKSIDQLAKAYGKTVLGTGVNPGMMMDLVAIVLSGVMTRVDGFQISRINSLSPFGPTVMQEQGVGLTQEEYLLKEKQKAISGHVGFRESAMMIAEALGLELSSFKQTMEPIVTEVERKSKYGHAAKGNVCGVNMKATAFFDNGLKLEMHHPQQIEPELGGVKTGDYIKILGVPEINMEIKPEVEGGLGTIAICVNMIPHVINASPGLKTMIDLPVPRAIVGDIRNLVEIN